MPTSLISELIEALGPILNPHQPFQILPVQLSSAFDLKRFHEGLKDPNLGFSIKDSNQSVIMFLRTPQK